MPADRETTTVRLSRIAAEMDEVAAELAELDPRSPAPALLRHWRTQIALAIADDAARRARASGRDS